MDFLLYPALCAYFMAMHQVPQLCRIKQHKIKCEQGNGRMWGQAAMAYCKISLKHVPEALAKVMKSLQQDSWFPVGIQMRTSEIQIRLTAMPASVKVIFAYNVRTYYSDHLKSIPSIIFKSDKRCTAVNSKVTFCIQIAHVYT